MEDNQIIEEKVRGNIPYIIAVIIIFTATAAIGLFLWNNKTKMMTENVVQEYLKNYYGEITQEMKILSKDMAEKIDERVEGIGTREFTDEELQELIGMVNEELETVSYNISQEEINKIANQIIKKVLEIKIEDDEELLKQYQNRINELSARVTTLEKRVALIKNYTDDDIKKIAKSLDITEARVIELIKKNASTTSASIDELAKELNVSEKELKKMIAESREYTDSLYISLSKSLNTSASDIKKIAGQVNTNTNNISDLAKKLKVTEDKLYDAIIESSELTDAEIRELAEKLNKDSEELKNMIGQDKQLTQTGIENISRELEVSISEIQTLINEKVGSLNISIGELTKEMGMKETQIYETIQRINSLNEEELTSLAQKFGIESEELRQLIDRLTDEMADNYEQMQDVLATKDALKQTQESIEASLNAEASQREEMTNKVIKDINAAIELSEGEDAKRLQEAKDALQEALNNGMVNIEDALKNANAQISSSINNIDVELEKLNSAITTINASIDTSNKMIAENKNAINKLDSSISDSNGKISENSEKITKNMDDISENKNAIDGLGKTKAEIYYSDSSGIPTLTIDSVIHN